MAKCNLGKVNLETMLASGLPSYIIYYAGVSMGWQGLHVLRSFLADRCGSLSACSRVLADFCGSLLPPSSPLW